MDPFSLVVLSIIGALAAATFLYVVIRLAVTHAIRAAARPAEAVPGRQVPS